MSITILGRQSTVVFFTIKYKEPSHFALPWVRNVHVAAAAIASVSWQNGVTAVKIHPRVHQQLVHQSFFGRLEGRKTLSKPPLVHLYPSSVHLEIISSGIFLTGLTVSVYGASWLDQLDSSPLRGQCTRFISFVFGTAFLAAGHLEIRCTEGGKFSWSAGDGGLTQCNHVIG